MELKICNNIKEEIQNCFDDNIMIDKKIELHLAECPECAKFYSALKQLRPVIKNSFENKINIDKKPDFNKIFYIAGIYKKKTLFKKSLQQAAAVFICVFIGYSSYLGIDKITVKIKVKNQVNYIVSEVFEESSLNDSYNSGNKSHYKLNDWKSDFDKVFFE